MDNIKIYKMTLSDLEEIKNILASDFDDFWNVNIFKEELLNLRSTYIVAKQNNKILGFAGIWKAVDDIHITNIVVNKSYRKQNIGSLLLSELIYLAQKEKEFTSITLEVNSINIPAIKLYEKFGFKNVGLRKKYYGQNQDAIIMTKELK